MIQTNLIDKPQSKMLYIPIHLCRVRVIRGLRKGKTNSLLNLISHQMDIYQRYLSAKYPHE